MKPALVVMAAALLAALVTLARLAQAPPSNEPITSTVMPSDKPVPALPALPAGTVVLPTMPAHVPPPRETPPPQIPDGALR